MRDERFIAEHRGGPLKKEQHIQLIYWACLCSENVFRLIDPVDTRLTSALAIARDWAKGKASVGDARKASVRAHDVARESDDPVVTAVARATGHAVATAHMADHSLGPALYALKAVKISGKPVGEERVWQRSQLRCEIRELVLSALSEKEKHFRI